VSIQAVAWVLEHSKATLADRLVFIAIANHCDAHGCAWPAVPQIALEARVDRATVFRALNNIVELGELTIRSRPGRASIYGIPAIMGSQDATGKGSQDATGGVASTRQRGRNLPPEPSRTIIEPRGGPDFPARCPQCGYLKFDCQCNDKVDKERAKEWVQAIRRGETP
jgi:hypothetical protein